MRDFGPDDRAAADAFYRGIGDPTAKAFLDLLIAHPDERFDTAAIADRLGLADHRDVARATYAMGQKLAAQGFARPWTEAQQGYAMPAATAALFESRRGA